MAFQKKINVTNSHESAKEIKIKEASRFSTEKEKIDGQIEKIYSEEIEKLEKPIYSFGRIFWSILIFSLIFGFIAGTLGGFFILTREKFKIPFLREIDLKKYFPTKEITITTEKKITISQDLRVAELTEELIPQIAKIALANTNKNSSLLDQIYTPSEILSQGFILTNDGWLVFPLTTSLTDLQKNYVVIIENKIMPIEKIISDPVTQTIFVKINASNLKTFQISNREEITPGQQVLIFNPENKLILNKISHPRYHQIIKKEDLIHSTDHFSDFILLENELSSDLIGSPVFSLDKSILGLSIDKNLVRPIWQLKNIIPLILEEKRIIRPYLGLNYLKLSEAIGIDDPRFKNFDNGVIVWGTPAKNSPAAKAGLKNGDLIIKIDGLPINGRYNLTDLVQEHKPNETIEITFIREGEEKTVKVVLEGR
jgi:serine protease Do